MIFIVCWLRSCVILYFNKMGYAIVLCEVILTILASGLLVIEKVILG